MTTSSIPKEWSFKDKTNPTVICPISLFKIRTRRFSMETAGQATQHGLTSLTKMLSSSGANKCSSKTLKGLATFIPSGTI